MLFETSMKLSSSFVENYCGIYNNLLHEPRACVVLKDTYRGRVCECPLVNGVQYKGDGYTSCEGKEVLLLVL